MKEEFFARYKKFYTVNNTFNLAVFTVIRIDTFGQYLLDSVDAPASSLVGSVDGFLPHRF